MLRRALARNIACVWLVIACGDDGLTPEMLVGEYELVTAGGSELPAGFGGSNYFKIFSGHYSLRGDLTYESRLSAGSCNVSQPHPCEPMTFVHTGTWRPFGRDSVEFWSAGQTRYLRAAGSVLRGCCAYGGAGEMVYVRR